MASPSMNRALVNDEATVVSSFTVTEFGNDAPSTANNARPLFALLSGGSYSNGNMVFDAEGNMWCGVNWLPGSQSGVRKSIGGGLIKFSPNGTPLSPPITGFTGMGVDGIGWGTAVALDKVWVASFNGAIGVHDFQGRTIGKESDIPFAGKTGGLMGIAVAPNGDVWIADGTKNQLLLFPGGQLKDGRIVEVAGLVSPFGIAIDPQNRVYVSNSQSDTVLRFPADDPSKVETFKVGICARGVAASVMSPDFPMPKIPAGVSIMEQFALILDALGKYEREGKKTGIVSMIRPDGTQPAPEGFTGGGTTGVECGSAAECVASSARSSEDSRADLADEFGRNDRRQ